MGWTLVPTTLAGSPVGQLRDAYDWTMTLGLSKVPTSTLRVRGDDPIAQYAHQDDLLLRVYDPEKVLRAHMLLAAVEEEGDETGMKMGLSFVGPAWRLDRRFLTTSPNGTTFTNQDKLVIVKSVLDSLNAANQTGIKTQSMSAGSTTTYTVEVLKSTLEVIQDLGDTLDGFDWVVDPIEPEATSEANVPYIGEFRGAATIGENQEEAVFEFATGKRNVRTWRHSKSWEGLGNRVFHVADSGVTAPGVPLIFAQDNTSITDRGLYEGIADATGLVDATLRQQLVAEHVAVRRVPRSLYQMTPTDDPSRVPQFGTDYDLGDIVTLRAAHGTIAHNGLIRVYGVTISRDINGKISQQPLLSPEGVE
jgi:hypothetical protein